MFTQYLSPSNTPLLLATTTNANFYPIEVRFGANKQRHVALNLRSTLTVQHEQTHLLSAPSDMVSQTKNDSLELTQLGAIFSKSHEGQIFAQALIATVHKKLLIPA